MIKPKILLNELANVFVRKKHSRTLRDILDLQRKIEDFLTKYHLQEKNLDFTPVFERIGQAKIEIVGIAYLAGKTIGTAKNVQGKHLRPLLEQVFRDLEDLKRGLFTKTARGSGLAERLARLHNSLEAMLVAISAAEYK